jgi:hypothetical protein
MRESQLAVAVQDSFCVSFCYLWNTCTPCKTRMYANETHTESRAETTARNGSETAVGEIAISTGHSRPLSNFGKFHREILDEPVKSCYLHRSTSARYGWTSTLKITSPIQSGDPRDRPIIQLYRASCMLAEISKIGKLEIPRSGTKSQMLCT